MNPIDDPSVTALPLARYNSIMNEIADRLDIVGAVNSGFVAQDPQLKAEICFLQLRKICELIALGCLHAHGDLGKGIHSSLLKKWHVNDIVRALRTLGDDFYPVPVVITNRDGAAEINNPEPCPILDKGCLIKLYNDASSVLHRGSLKKLFDGKTVDASPQIEDASKRIVALLTQHRINLVGYDRQLYCTVKDARTYRAASFIAQSPKNRAEKPP